MTARPLNTVLNPPDKKKWANMVVTYSHVIPKMSSIDELKITDIDQNRMEEEWFDYILVTPGNLFTDFEDFSEFD